MSRPFESYPRSGTEAYDNLGDRLQIRLLTNINNADLSAGEVDIRHQFVFDNQPLGTTDNWPAEDPGEELEQHLIPRNHFVAEVGYSGPQPRDYYNASGRALQRDAKTYGDSIDGSLLRPGTYRYSIVAVAHIVAGGRPIIAARRLDIEFVIRQQDTSANGFWVVEYTNRAWGSHIQTRFSRFDGNRVQATADGIVLPMKQRAPNNLLIDERLFDFDETNGDVYSVTVPVANTFDHELRRIDAAGNIHTLPAINGIDTRKIIALAVDGGQRRLWLALPNQLVVVSLDDFRVIKNHERLIAPVIQIDPRTHELWVAAHRRDGAGPATYTIARYGLSDRPSVEQKAISVTALSAHAVLLPLNNGGLVVVGTHQRTPKYLMLDSAGNIQASSQPITEPIIQTAVNPANGEVWESVLKLARIPTIRHRNASFGAINEIGFNELKFANLYGVDYIPEQQVAVVTGNARFSTPPPVRGQLATIANNGQFGSIPYSGSVMAILKSIR
ncbi:MAG: hypothetical protein Tsb002_29320 [Wenzhouxiangellaceae bacterium]